MVIIDKQGLVSLGFEHCTLSSIYTFVHDIANHHFNNQQHIEHIKFAFTKKYIYNNLVTTLRHEIQKTDIGFLWKITRNVLIDELHSCIFGITIPLGKFSIEDKDGPILTALINFQQQWQNKYIDQTNIDLPILRLVRNDPLIVCTPITDSVQFFRFEENDMEYLKIATQTGEEMSLTIYFVQDNQDDLKQVYCDVFPENKDYVYRADILKQKIKNKYGIRVLSHEMYCCDDCTIYPPNPDELESYMSLLEDNLDFYPLEVFNLIQLKSISVCGYLLNNDKLIKGRSERGEILLNASEKLSYNTKCRVIHHEIFHIIEQFFPPFQTVWESLPPEDSFTKHFKEVRAITHPVEYRCELFATFVLDPRFVFKLSDKDAVVRKKLNIVRTIFGKIGKECREIAQNHNQDTENVLIYIYEPVIDNESIKSTQSTQSTEQLLIGIKHSCLPDLIHVLNEIPDSLIVDDPSQIPTRTNLAYVTINPLDFCAIEYIEQQIPAEDSFAQWIAMHTALESNNSVLRLKSEDILTCNIYVVRNFLKGVGVSFETHSLWNITKEIRPYHFDSVPFLKKIWGLFRNSSIVTRVGYRDISYEE